MTIFWLQTLVRKLIVNVISIYIQCCYIFKLRTHSFVWEEAYATQNGKFENSNETNMKVTFLFILKKN